MLRQRAGVSQSEIARRIGVHPSITSLWEQGRTLVPGSRFRQLAGALHVSIDALLAPAESLSTPPVETLPWAAAASGCQAPLDGVRARGYWLDPTRAARPAASSLLRERLCPNDRRALGEAAITGASVLERIQRHCSHDPAFLASLPVAETIFRLVLASDGGGVHPGELQERLATLGRDVSVHQLVRLQPALAPYPIRSATGT